MGIPSEALPQTDEAYKQRKSEIRISKLETISNEKNINHQSE